MKLLRLVFLINFILITSCSSHSEKYKNMDLILLKDIQLDGSKTVKNYIRDDNLGRGCSMEVFKDDREKSIIKKGTQFKIENANQEDIHGKKFTIFKIKSTNDLLMANLECWKILTPNYINQNFRSYESTLDAFHTVFDWKAIE